MPNSTDSNGIEMRMYNRYLFTIFLALSSCQTLAVIEPWAENFRLPPGDYSWIQLDTSEWLKGEIIALYDDTLVFDSDHFGNVNVDLDDVEAVYGQGVFTVSFSDGRGVSGTLNIRGPVVSIATQDGSKEFNRYELVSITQKAVRERDRWTGNLDVGLNVREGNTDISEFDAFTELTRRTRVSRSSLNAAVIPMRPTGYV